MSVLQQRYQRKGILYWFVFIIFLAILLILFAFVTYQKEMEKTQLRLNETAHNFVSLTSFYLDEVDRMLLDFIQHQGTGAPLEALVAHRQRSNPQLADILIFDAQGPRVLGSDKIDVSALWLRHQRQASSQPLLMPPERSSQGDQEWVFSLSRGHYDERGALQALAVAVLRIDSLSALFHTLTDDPLLTVALVSQNGQVLFRFPQVDLSPDHYLRMPQGVSLPIETKYQLQTISPLDGRERRVLAYPLADYPLFVMTSTEVRQALSVWKVTQGWALLLWLLVTLASLLAMRWYLQQRDKQHGQLDLFSRSLPGFFYQLEMTPDGGFHYRYAGHRVQEMFGITSKQVLENPQALLERIHPDDIAWILKESIQAAQSGSEWSGVYRMRLADGKYGWIESRDIPEILEDGTLRWVGYANNISSRKDLERELQVSEARYQSLVENANDIIFTLSIEGKFVYVSPQWQHWLGHKVEQVVGAQLASFIHPDDFADLVHVFEGSLRSGQHLVGIEYRIQDIKGDWHWQMFNGGPLTDSDGSVNEFIGIARDITEQREMQATLRRMAMHDALTGLANRTFFFEMAANTLEMASRYRRHFALLFIDLDHFKPINDQFGHAIGDRLLKEVAQRMKASLRASDIPGRIGGDEFVVLLTEVAHLDAAKQVAKKLGHELSLPYEIESVSHLVTASIGIALYPDDGITLKQLAANADQAMYHAKFKGRNQVLSYADYLMGRQAFD